MKIRMVFFVLFSLTALASHEEQLQLESEASYWAWVPSPQTVVAVSMSVMLYGLYYRLQRLQGRVSSLEGQSKAFEAAMKGALQLQGRVSSLEGQSKAFEAAMKGAPKRECFGFGARMEK